MKKTTKIMAGILGFILIVGILWVANGFIGNPISKLLADKEAEKYIHETYPDMDLEISKAAYNFKTGGYNVFVELPSSLDTHFSLEISPTGDIRWDSYEGYVSGKFNTWDRVNMEYRKMVDDVFESNDFIYKSEINFGELKLKEKESYESFGPLYGLNLEELELDKIYDIKELGKKNGHILLYIEEDQIDVTNASKLLLDVKRIFDNKSVQFYAIDFTLQEPRTEENMRNRKSFGVKEFLYSDIYEENLIKRLEIASKELNSYYESEDAKKEKLNY